MFRVPSGLPGKSIKTQLIILLFVLTTVAVSVLSFLGVRALTESGRQSGTIAASSMQERVKQLLEDATVESAESNSIIFKNIERETLNSAEYAKNVFEHPGDFPNTRWRFDDHMFHRTAGNYANSGSELSSVFIQSTLKVTPALKREIELTSYFDELFPQILKNEPNAVAVYFDGAQGETRYYPNIELEKLVPPDYDSTTGEYFVPANPQNDPDGSFKWSKVYDDPAGNGLTITAAQPLYTPGHVFNGMVEMDVTLTNIAKNIEDYNSIRDSYAFLIDDAGRAIALPAQGYHDLLNRAPKDKEFGSDLKDVKGDFGAVLKNMRAGKHGFTTAKSNGTDLYVSYAPIEGTPFSLALVARQAAMLGVVAALKNQVSASTTQALYYRFVPAGLACLLAVWVFGFIYIRRVTRPIKELTAKTALVAAGNFEVEPEAANLDNEVGQLASSFNKMVGDLRASRQKIDEQNQELLHNEQARLKASINSLNVGFVMTDTNGETIMLNGAARKILSRDKMKNWTTDEIDGQLGETVGFKQMLTKVLRTGKAVEKKEAEFDDLVLRIFISPILETNPSQGVQKLGAVVLVENITEAKVLERSKDEFFSIASHELRTPLTAIRGNAAMMQRVYGPKVHEQDFDEMAGDIHDASVRLIEIVNDFLDATRLEQGRIIFENQAFSIFELLQAVTDEMDAVAKETGTSIKIDAKLASLPAIFADKNRVKQVIYNLVGNAMKFTAKGTVSLDGRVEGKSLKIFVHDTGPGISEENQQLLFRKFQQASNSFMTRDTRGTGLGLYISKLLAEQMGGRVTLESSELGVGTTFSVALPVAKASQITPKQP